jgi:oxygen-independent coproporphyrinogen-3 oxidase
VSSFGHISGTHYQNRHRLHEYLADVQNQKVPVYRALTPSKKELLTRETILQFKLGSLDPRYFQEVYGANIRTEFDEAFQAIAAEGFLVEDTPERIALSRDGLLQVDRLLHYFFLPEHRNARYA